MGVETNYAETELSRLQLDPITLVLDPCLRTSARYLIFALVLDEQ